MASEKSGEGVPMRAKKEFVKIISSGNHVFIVERRIAEVSQTIKRALNSSLREGDSREIRFPEISTKILERVIQYCHFKFRYTNSTTPIPEFHIQPDEALDLLLASNYLEC